MAREIGDIAKRIAALRKRLAECGKWTKFEKELKAHARLTGMPRAVCEVMLSLNEKYLPTDGTPPEFDQEYCDLVRKNLSPIASHRTEEAKEEAAEIIKIAASVEKPSATVSSNRTGPRNDEWESLRRRVAGIFMRGKAKVGTDEATVARWVFAHAASRVNEIHPDEVPGVGAIRLLQNIQSSSANYDDFIKNCWSKMLTKALDSGTGMNYAEEGKRHLRMMERLEMVDSDDDVETFRKVFTTADELESSDENSTVSGDDGDQGEEPIPEAASGPEGLSGEHEIPDQGVEGGGSE